jgi:hypothetical protein
MIVCVCRNIKESDYDTSDELLNRLKDVDICCGHCVEYCEQQKRTHYSSRSGKGDDKTKIPLVGYVGVDPT